MQGKKAKLLYPLFCGRVQFMMLQREERRGWHIEVYLGRWDKFAYETVQYRASSSMVRQVRESLVFAVQIKN